MSVTSALVPGGGFVPLLAAAAGRPASTPAQVLRAYAALDQLLLLKSEPSERSSAGGDDDGSGHIGSPTTLRGGPSGGAGPLEVGASLPECSMPPYRDSWNGGVASELQGAGPSRGAAPAARGKKRGPKRTVPNLEDLEAQLAQKQAEVQQLERRNVQLRRRKALLETVIACRDSQVARLQAQTAGGSHGVNEAHTLLSSAQAQLPHQPRCWQASRGTRAGWRTCTGPELQYGRAGVRGEEGRGGERGSGVTMAEPAGLPWQSPRAHVP